MKNKAMNDIFDPQPINIIIGTPKSLLFSCGKNEHCELSFRGYKHVDNPSGLKIGKTKNIIDVSCGANHTALLTTYGYVYVLGSTLHEKLGIGN